MRKMNWQHIALRAFLILIASAGPMAFPLSQMGYSTLHELAGILILPSIAVLAMTAVLLRKSRYHHVAAAIAYGTLGGAVATLALEAVRYTGFRLGFMPGNLPELLGVLLLDRFALGPSTGSTIAGFAYHFWNGAAFGIILALIAQGRSRWWSVAYGIAIGLGFLVSPVVQALGVGIFGKDFGWHFAATVLLAHAAFGAALGCFVLLPCPWRAIYQAGANGSAWIRTS